MNDHHLDPPEEAEVPECCGYEMVVKDDGSCKCPECRRTIAAPVEPDPAWEANEVWELPDEEGPTECPHGRAWVECDACYHASDLAYDAAREGRMGR